MSEKLTPSEQRLADAISAAVAERVAQLIEGRQVAQPPQFFDVAAFIEREFSR